MVQFLADLISRLFSSKPWFFKVIQVAAAALGILSIAISKLADAGLLDGSNKIVAAVSSGITVAVSITAIIMAQLPKKDANAVAKS